LASIDPAQRPARDPTKAYGFVGMVTSLKDLSSSIWLWHQSNGKFEVKKGIGIPAESSQLPPLRQGFKAVPPLLTDINPSVDDRFLMHHGRIKVRDGKANLGASRENRANPPELQGSCSTTCRLSTGRRNQGVESHGLMTTVLIQILAM
jgi:hypothetical protein